MRAAAARRAARLSCHSCHVHAVFILLPELIADLSFQLDQFIGRLNILHGPLNIHGDHTNGPARYLQGIRFCFYLSNTFFICRASSARISTLLPIDSIDTPVLSAGAGKTRFIIQQVLAMVCMPVSQAPRFP